MSGSNGSHRRGKTNRLRGLSDPKPEPELSFSQLGSDVDDDDDDAETVLSAGGSWEDQSGAEPSADPGALTVTIPVAPQFQEAFVHLLLQSCSPLAKQTVADQIMRSMLDPSIVHNVAGAALIAVADQMLQEGPLKGQVENAVGGMVKGAIAELKTAASPMAAALRRRVAEGAQRLLSGPDFAKLLRDETLKIITAEVRGMIVEKAGGRKTLREDIRDIGEQNGKPLPGGDE